MRCHRGHVDPDQTHGAYKQSAEGVVLLKDPGRGRDKALLAVTDNLQLLRFFQKV